MRKFRLTAFVVLMLFTLSSCSDKTQSNDSKTAEELMNKAYSKIDIKDNVPVSNIQNISYLGDSDKFLITGFEENDDALKLFVTDADFTDFRFIDWKLDESYTLEKNCITSTSDGNIVCIVNSDERPDDEMTEIEDRASMPYHICVFDKNGSLISNNEIKENGQIRSEGNEEIYFGNAVALDDKILVNINNTENDHFFLMNTEGIIINDLYLGENVCLFNTGNDTDGNAVFSTSDNKGEIIKFINSESQKVLNDTIILDDYEIEIGTQTITRGINDYKIFFSTSQCLYGLKQENIEEVINWSDSDLNGQYIKNVLALPNDEFIILSDDWSSDENEHLYRLTKRDMSELADVKVIILATEYADSDLIKMVNKFNDTHSECRIKIRDYQKYYNTGDNSNSPQKQLKMDIVTGEQFDILMLDSEDDLLYNLEKKGMFTDIGSLMDKNGGVNRDDIVPNVLKSCESNGKILKIAPTFTIQTLVAKKKFIDKESWTVDEMIDIYSDLEGKMQLLNYCISKTDLFMTLFINYNNHFVDYNENKCSFNSSEFINLLEFVNGLDLENKINWEEVDDSEYEALYNTMGTACLNDKALLQMIQLSDARTYTRTKYGIFGDDISLVGFPTSTGNGAKLILGKIFAIAEQSACKDECWEFISRFFTDDFYNNYSTQEFPALKKNFDNVLNDAMNDPFFLDEKGNKESFKDSLKIDYKETEIPNLSLEERKMLEEYIFDSEITGYGNYVEISKIIKEEISAYFNGECSAEATADYLQNRVSNLLDENQ